MPHTILESLGGVADAMVSDLLACPDAAVALDDLSQFDSYTHRHSVQVTVLGLLLARRIWETEGWMDFRGRLRRDRIEERLRKLGVGLLVHDIGKLAVPAELLRKTGKLSAPDWERVKRHPELGAEIIGEHDDPLLKVARQMALYHHEHWDGSGYPEGIKGADIPWPGRMMAIVDSFESMTTTQFYRAPLNVLEAAAEIQEGSGRRFDPKLVDAFRKALPQMRKVLETYSDELGDLIDLDFSPGRGAGAKAQKAAKKSR
jgi:HD-GYP domain-containing protein (c-di-GMP phosphodiesterase class II)